MEKDSIVKIYNVNNSFLNKAERIVTMSNINFVYDRKTSRGEITDPNAVSYTHLTLPTILLV